jgi:hypothetical protein
MFRAGVNPSIEPSGKASLLCAPRHMTSRAPSRLGATLVGELVRNMCGAAEIRALHGPIHLAPYSTVLKFFDRRESGHDRPFDVSKFLPRSEHQWNLA